MGYVTLVNVHGKEGKYSPEGLFLRPVSWSSRRDSMNPTGPVNTPPDQVCILCYCSSRETAVAHAPSPLTSSPVAQTASSRHPKKPHRHTLDRTFFSQFVSSTRSSRAHTHPTPTQPLSYASPVRDTPHSRKCARTGCSLRRKTERDVLRDEGWAIPYKYRNENCSIHS